MILLFLLLDNPYLRRVEPGALGDRSAEYAIRLRWGAGSDFDFDSAEKPPST